MSESFTIYFAGGLFNHKELVGNALLASYIEQCSEGRYTCIVPQDLEHPTRRGVDIRNNDLKHVLLCDLGLFNFDGTELDSGTVVEFMFAKALDIPAVILRSDPRVSGDQDRDDWNLMCSFYPRTGIVRFNGIAWYKTARRESGVLSEAIDRLYIQTASRLIEALDAVRGEPPLPKGEQLQLEALYHWALRFPGSGLEELCAEPGFIEQVVARKRSKGLL
jgi:nucleoside 2-deoxyribosyltransferase